MGDQKVIQTGPMSDFPLPGSEAHMRVTKRACGLSEVIQETSEQLEQLYIVDF